MWRCPNCSEPIDDQFDACWKCGTAQEGTPAADVHAHPDDPVATNVDSNGGSRESKEEPPPDHDLYERLVEVCSASNVVEADGLCELLEEAGIRARVVGEGLGVAAGGLALGEDVSPRIWVRESDLERAREVIERSQVPQANEPAEAAESEELSENEVPPDAELAELPSDDRFRFLSQGFYIVGMVCFVVGVIWAWQNSMVLSKYSGTSLGLFVDAGLGELKLASVPPENGLPPGRVPGESLLRCSCIAKYTYTVRGKTYQAFLKVDHVAAAPLQITVRYDPLAPADNMADSIAPPSMILLFASLIGVFFCFVGYQFR